MKRIIYLLAGLLIANLSIGQIVPSASEECVSCKNNEVDFSKYASAIGTSNISTGNQSFAGGNRSTASGNLSFAFGYQAIAGGISSIAFGYQAQATGMYSAAIGRGSIATGDAAFALGYKNTAQATSSYVFGENLKSVAGGSVTIGMGAGAGDDNLLNNKAYSLMVGFNSDIPTFFVSGSSGTSTTGKIGIGNITEPQAKLHILGDDGLFNEEDASLFIQSSGNYYSIIWLGDTEHSIMAKPGSDLTFHTSTNMDFLFKNGNIQIQSGFQLETETVVASQIKAPDANGLNLTNQNGDGIFVADGGNVGIGLGGFATTPNALLHLYEMGGPPSKLRFESTVGVPGAANDCWDIESDLNFSISYGQGSGGGSNPTMTKRLVIRSNGNVGIGTNTAEAKLQVNGDVRLLSDNVVNQLQILDNGQLPERRGISLSDDPDGAFNLYIHSYQTNAAFNFKDALNDDYLVTIKKNGSVGIGTTETTGYKLAVAGKILATELKIVENVPSSDYVFYDDYDLRPLSEVERYIGKHKHLPEVPSAKEFKENGYCVGEMDDLLLRKIEELTLYLIEQQKIIDKQQKDIGLLEKLIEKK